MENLETVILTKEEHDSLLRASLKLQALENAGVDNWDWYGDAMDEYEQLLEEHEL